VNDSQKEDAMKRFVAIMVVVFVCGTLLLSGCGSDGSGSSNPVAPSGPVDSNTSVVFRILRPSDNAAPDAPQGLVGAIRAASGGVPSVTFTLRLINSGDTASPVTTLTRTIPATASGTSYAAVASFSDLPPKTVIGDIAITGGTLDGLSRFRGAMDLGTGSQNVLDLAGFGTYSAPDLKAQVLEWLIGDSAAFASATGRLVAQIDSAFAKAGIASGAGYTKAYVAFNSSASAVVSGSAQELIISELSTSLGYTNDGRWIEIYNNSPAAIDLADYSLNTSTWAGGQTWVAQTSFSLPSLSLPSGAYAVVRVKAYNTYQDGGRIVHVIGGTGDYPFWWKDGYVELVRNSDGQTADFVSFGTNTTKPTTTSAWSGNAVAALPSIRWKSLVRTRTLTDTNTSADWTLNSWPTPGGPNDVANPNDTDADADGIPDGCEVSGTTYVGLPLAAWGAQPGRKDVFIHIDHMTSTHLGLIPKVEALDKVVSVFASKGWAVHFDVGTLIPKYNLDGKSHEVPFAEYMWLGTQAGSADIYTYKSQYLDLAKRQIFYYCVFANKQNGSSSTGRGERPGNDFMINLGGVDFTNTSNGYFTQAELDTYLVNEQAALVMHEFGHNLGLHHGGAEARNFKPNYLSIMNYLYSWYGLPTVTDARAGDRYYQQKYSEDSYSKTGVWFLNHIRQPDGSWGSKYMHNNPYSSSFVLDFSTGKGAALDETRLDESVGLNHANCPAIDWDGDGTSNQTLTNFDINPSDDTASNTTADTITDFDDWGNVAIYFGVRSNDFFSRRVNLVGSRRFSFQTDDHEPVADCERIAAHSLLPLTSGGR